MTTEEKNQRMGLVEGGQITMPDKITLPKGVSGFRSAGKLKDGVFSIAFKAQYHGHTVGHLEHFLMEPGQVTITEVQYEKAFKKFVQYIQSHV